MNEEHVQDEASSTSRFVQNIYLCLLFAAFGGLFAIMGRAVVIKGMQRKKAGVRTTRWEKIKIRSGSIAMLVMANVFVFIAPWFGPVSLYWPGYVSSQLLVNMILIGFIMKHETFDKKTRVACFVIIAAVVNITINGPAIQENQDAKELVLGNPVAIAWLAVLSSVYVVCVILMLFSASKMKSSFAKEVIFFVVSTFSSTLAATTSKAASTLSGVDGPMQAILIATTWIIVAFWTIESLNEATHVRSLARFIPQTTFGSLTMNALTGMIVWQDYLVVRSWAGYATAYSLMVLGIYLISDLDFIRTQAEEIQEFQSEFFSSGKLSHEMEADLSCAKFERRLNRYQLTISDQARNQGLKRGNSDPELCSTGRSTVGNDQTTRTICSGTDDGTSTRRMGRGPIIPAPLCTLTPLESYSKSS